jgi:hypothetical protein
MDEDILVFLPGKPEILYSKTGLCKEWNKPTILEQKQKSSTIDKNRPATRTSLNMLPLLVCLEKKVLSREKMSCKPISTINHK